LTDAEIEKETGVKKEDVQIEDKKVDKQIEELQ
jgi:hypothetical protein